MNLPRHAGKSPQARGLVAVRTEETGFAVAVGRAMGTVVVTVRGDLDLPRSTFLAAVLSDLIDGQGNLAVLVDLRRLGRIDPGGLEMLAQKAKSLERRGGRLRLHEPRPPIRDALALAGLMGLVTMDGRMSEWTAPIAMIHEVGVSDRTLHPAGSRLFQPGRSRDYGP